MPIYMDLHIVPGINAKDVANAHSMDVLMEKEHSCKCLTYWVDELRGYVFCLIDAPDKETVVELHTRAHGLVPNKVIEVEPSLVHAFLGRITDPENAHVTDKGLLVMDDTSYRIIMHLQTRDSVLLRHELGDEKAAGIMEQFRSVVKEQVLKNNGREVFQSGSDITTSFVEGNKAFAAALAIGNFLDLFPVMEARISLHAGEPVAQSDKLFGDTVQLLKRFNASPRSQLLAITAGVRELLSNEMLNEASGKILVYSSSDEAFVTALFDALESKFAEEDFDIERCCHMLAMSQSQLYRKTTQLFQQSPNHLLRNYRLMRAMEQLKLSDRSVSQVSFDTGFSSPSYFTKCFKSYCGLLPLAYQSLAKGI